MLKILIITLFIFLISCGDEPKHPSSPVWVEKSRPEDLEEQGIDAHNVNLIHPEQNSIKLMWYPNPEEDIWKYYVYRTKSVDEETNNPIDFSSILITESDTSFVDENVGLYVEYYYYLKVENFDGINSATSDTVTYKLLTKPQAISYSNLIHSEQLQFQWIDSQHPGEIPNYYAVKVENESGQGIWSCLFLNPDFLNSGEIVSYLYSLNGSACVEHHGTDEYLDSGKYYWKIKPLRLGNGITTSADHDVVSAESNWVEINIID